MDAIQLGPTLLLTIYCVLILIASLAGGWIPIVVRLTHTRLQVAISFVSGFMLGIGVLHLLPHAWYELQSLDRVAAWMLTGFLIMFFIQRFFHFHHHDVSEEAPERGDCHAPHTHPRADQDHGHPPTLAHISAGQLSWGGAALGLALHTLLDGVAVAASVEAATHSTEHAAFLGIGTFLVVILHKPFDAMAVGTLMAASGSSKISRHVANACFALAFPLGALLFHFFAGRYASSVHQYVGVALAFSAGTFLCIAASDLLPELQFHSHDRVKLSIALLLGIAFAVLIGKLEPEGSHQHDNHNHSSLTPAPPFPRSALHFRSAEWATRT